MRFIERLRQELAQAKRLKASRGLAMLLVVIVLSTLLVVGVLFTATASLDVQASAFYRQAAQAELFALEGLYRAIAELYYDVWGVNESTAFFCADADDPATAMIDEGTLSDAAYYTTKLPPDPAVDEGGKVKATWSKFRRSIGDVVGQRTPYPVLTDLRWMVRQADSHATAMYVGRDPNDPMNPPFLQPATHSGAPYHDEFLPEFTDSSDAWELGVHLNAGDIFGRGWGPDDQTTGGLWTPRPEGWGGYPMYWPGRRPLREYDYIDTRIVGDSFYKIFRFELIDPATKRSYAAGLDPLTGNYVEPTFTHLKNGSTAMYLDTRGGAININQVNNNYQWELYWGWDVAAEGDQPASADSYHMYHYNESKWIYVYNTEGDRKLGRYAVLVWPDTGSPNANMQYDITEIVSYDWGGTGRHTSDYFRSLDWGFTPHGGPVNQCNNIRSEIVEGYEAIDWADALGTRVGDYKNAEDVFVDAGGGVVSSRAEMSMFVRKACFTQSANASVAGWTHEEAAWDAHIISSLVTVNGYEYLLDHHWANDRLVIDKLGLSDGVLGATYPGTKPIRSGTSFFSSATTQARYFEVLDKLRFTWGPDWREGRYTQYHNPGTDTGKMRSRWTRAAPISWLAHHWFYTRNDFHDNANRPYGIRLNDAGPYWKDKVVPADVLNDPYLAVGRIDFPVISEVGKITYPSSSQVSGWGLSAWGWDAKYDPTGAGGDPTTVYFDGNTSKYFIEIVKYWEMDYTHTCMNIDRTNWLYVNGKEILNDPQYAYTTRVIGIDNKGDQGGQYKWYQSCEDDWSPKAVPTENQFKDGVLAGAAMRGDCGEGGHGMATFTLNKYRNGGQDEWPESWNKSHCANYLVFTFDTSIDVSPRADGRTTIVYAMGTNSPGVVLDVVHLPKPQNVWDPAAGVMRTYPNVFECGFDAYDPANNHGNPPGKPYDGNWAPNLLGTYPNRASPCWRAKYGYNPSGSSAVLWHNKNKSGKIDNANAGGWLDGLNYHHIMSYLPGGEQAPANALYPMTISDVRDMSGAGSMVAAHSQEIISCWGGRGGARDWEGFTKCPTGFWAEENGVLNKYVPDPFLRFLGDLARVTPLARVITPGYLGNYGDNIASLGEHSIYDEVDNDMNGHIDNLTDKHIAGGPSGHYLADRKAIGRMNINEMQHPAAIWYGGFCNGGFGSQNLFVGRKPFKGYTTWFDCLKRGIYGQNVWVDIGPYDMEFWYENQWADPSSDNTNMGRFIEENVCWDVKDTSRVLFAGNSAVYTVYVTGQVLHDSKDPIAETKLRATVERTWDGKMNILEFCWIPKDIITEE